jgi:alpha-tubulin suppressor-like RCC1 family protein
MIDTGGSHSCGVDAQLNARCWGSNYYGQLGDGTTIDHANPTPPIWGGVTSLAVGGDFVCAVSGGNVVCWGNNHYGQLGESSTVTPTRTAPGPAVVQGATSVVAGLSHACALLQSGSVKCWGYDATTNKGNEAPFDIAPFCP